MAEEDDAPRKKRVRGAHRASVTRLISQLEEAMESDDARRLKQLKQSLTDKTSVLAKLDDELIGLVEEEQLEAEVEQADLIRERIGLAIISIEDALEGLVAKTRETGRGDKKGPHRKDTRHRAESGSSRSSESGEEGERSLPPSSPSTSDGHADPEAITCTSSMDSPLIVSPHSSLAPLISMTLPIAPPPITGPPLSFLPSVSSMLGALPHSTAPPITTTSTLPSLLSTTLSGSSSLGATGFGVPPSCSVSYPLLVAPPSLHPPSVRPIMPQVKLPKLSIKKFSGDLTRWVTFWDSFDSSIHANPTLSSVDKFNYLNSLVDSTAAEAIAGLAITSANYDEAIATLRKRFGNPQLIVNRHMEALLAVAAVPSHLNIKCLRKLHDTVEAHVRGLRALGVPAESYGGLLTSVLVNKLPPEIRLIVSRETTAGRWDLDVVMKILEREVDARERASSTGASTAPPEDAASDTHGGCLGC